ncbi:ACR2.2 [Symbiodinium microadriaticum]|nr:ACR2.2 [Symbiodinium microadriaticum]
MPVRQIYVMPRAVVPATANYQTFAFRCHVPAKAANVPLVQPAATTRPFVPAPAPPKQERMQPSVVQTTKTVVSAPRPSATSGLVGPNFEVPLNKGVERLSAQEVHQLLRAGLCVLVDVRACDRASGRIQGAVHEPTTFQAPLLNRVPELVDKFAKEKLVIFHCQYSMHRGPQCANWYRERAPTTQRVAILEGGFRGWEGQHLPVLREQPMDAHSQGKADVYALSMGRRLAGAGA